MTCNLEQSWLKMDDGTDIFVRSWKGEGKPKAILQILHGMAEHIGRYEPFAKFLVEKGIWVYGHDHRGHGETGKKAGLFGFFAEENGFDKVTADSYNVTLHIKKEFADVPLFLFGHSMGSFIARRYIQKYRNGLAGVILSGTTGNPGLLGKVGKWLAKREMKKLGKRTPSPLMDKLIFGSYNKGFEAAKNKFAWLSRDEEEVEKYIQDPYCGFVCTSGFFYDLLSGLEKIHDAKEIRNIQKDLPFFIFSGDRDPVGAYSIGVKKVIEQYKKHGINNITSVFYRDGRHEMLNEINRNIVFLDIWTWIDKQLSAIKR